VDCETLGEPRFFFPGSVRRFAWWPLREISPPFPIWISSLVVSERSSALSCEKQEPWPLDFFFFLFLSFPRHLISSNSNKLRITCHFFPVGFLLKSSPAGFIFLREAFELFFSPEQQQGYLLVEAHDGKRAGPLWPPYPFSHGPGHSRERKRTSSGSPFIFLPILPPQGEID